MPADKIEDRIASCCVAFRVRMLGRIISNLYDEALRPLGIKGSQLGILVVAAKLGVARPAQVCGILHLDPSTLSRNVERMRAHGWLENVPEDDARTQPFQLTKRGRDMLDRAAPHWERAQTQANELIGREGTELLNLVERRLSAAG